MEEKFGFKKLSIIEFESWLNAQRIARTVLTVQEHHTWLPSYVQFDGSNHFEMQRGMRDHHVHVNGWQDIGQHLSIFPDGTVLTGRSFELAPACILNQNGSAICIENIGDFDQGKDQMTHVQKNNIIRVTAVLCKKFSIPLSTNNIVYHHWFNLSTGERNNGSGNNKSCPGTNFFGGNKVGDCETHFIPEVSSVHDQLPESDPQEVILKYVCIDADLLNVRSGPHHKLPIARSPLSRGSILRVFKIAENGWQKIAGTKEHWVSGKFTYQAWKAIINRDGATSRAGSGENFVAVNEYNTNDSLFVKQIEDDWRQINMTMEWLHKNDLTIS